MNIQSIFESLVGTYCCFNDSNLSFLTSATTLHALAGYTFEDIQTESKNNLMSLIVSENSALVYQKLKDSASDEGYTELVFQIQHKNGNRLWVLNRSKKVFDENGNEYICGLLTDISNIKYSFDQARRDLQTRAEQDPLTNLLNNSTARQQAFNYLNSAPEGPYCALLILDLDNFKQINDRYGHMYGDQVLVRTAQEIRKFFRSGDIISRIGGDEFMVLMKNLKDQHLVHERCQALLNAINSITIDVEDFCGISISVGVAFLQVPGINYNELFKHADHALYHAKRKGKNRYAVYDGK